MTAWAAWRAPSPDWSSPSFVSNLWAMWGLSISYVRFFLIFPFSFSPISTARILTSPPISTPLPLFTVRALSSPPRLRPTHSSVTPLLLPRPPPHHRTFAYHCHLSLRNRCADGFWSWFSWRRSSGSVAGLIQMWIPPFLGFRGSWFFFFLSLDSILWF